MSIRQVLIFCCLSLVVSVSTSIAQAPATTASKIVIIDTAAFFNEKSGITKIVAATKTLNTEMATRKAEVVTMATRIEALSREIDAVRSNAARGVPIDQRSLQTKIDEIERLKREGKYKEDEYNALVKRRQGDIVGPVYSEVLKTLAEYIKTKDYGLIFDASKDQSGILLFASEKYDITKEFIAYYNARPVTAIAPVPR